MSYQLPAAVFLSTGTSINALGDSISAQSYYQPVMTPPATFPAWTSSTTYILGQCISNGGYAFYCTTAGTSAAAGPGPAGQGSPPTTPITDGSANWSWISAGSNKDSYLGWAETFSLGALTFDQTQGYGGPNLTLRKILVVNGGTGYSANPVLSLNQGASATATVAGGVITSVTITNPGHGPSGFTVTVADSSGSGAILSAVQDGSGTFAVSGCQTTDMVARLPDCLASSVSIFAVLGGRNDVVSNASFSTITGNLRTCYETLINAGRCVVAVPILPAYQFTPANSALVARVNRWIRAYVRQLAFANPNAYTRIAIADCSKFFADGAVLTSFWPVGGPGGTASAVTMDGTHPNTRGRVYLGAAVAQAVQKFTGPNPLATARAYTALDGYDPTLNPGGNVLEALPWAASTYYVVGQQRSSSGNVYRCTTAGTSAATAGPSGTTGGLTDGTVVWAFARPMGMSVFGSAGTGTLTAASGITYSGNLAGGYTLIRTTGSASGTVNCAVETPWSDGTAGQRQSLAFALNGGAASEIWALRALYGTYGLSGALPAELGAASCYAEAEIEVSNNSNLSGVYLSMNDNTVGWYNVAGATLTGAGWRLPGSSDVLAIPNNGRMLLRTSRNLLPANLVNLNLMIYVHFDASGAAAGSAAATVKINYMGLFRALTA